MVKKEKKIQQESVGVTQIIPTLEIVSVTFAE